MTALRAPPPHGPGGCCSGHRRASRRDWRSETSPSWPMRSRPLLGPPQRESPGSSRLRPPGGFALLPRDECSLASAEKHVGCDEDRRDRRCCTQRKRRFVRRRPLHGAKAQQPIGHQESAEDQRPPAEEDHHPDVGRELFALSSRAVLDDLAHDRTPVGGQALRCPAVATKTPSKTVR